MQLTPILTLVAALSLTGCAGAPAQAQPRGDDLILEMHQAFRKNDKARLSALLPQARGHVLEAWAAFWELRVRLDTASTAEIQAFLSRYAGTYQEDRLRADWLLQLGKRRDWATFSSEYPLYRMGDDREIRCYALGIEAMNRKADVSAEIRRQWHALRELDDGCTYMAEHLHSGRQMDKLELWRKARLAMDANRP